MPAESKTKIRPQQSCLRCRERKVKCDRSIPCHACIIRGLEAECTYLTTPEDRAHISQSEIIAQLRREVAQLRGRLNQASREPSYNETPSSDQGSEKSKRWRQNVHGVDNPGNAHGYGPGSGYLIGLGSSSGSATGTPDGGEGSWRGSSPSSTTTMTNSVAVTSPDSTGSESRARSASVSSPPVSVYPFATGHVPRIAELDGSTTVEPSAYGNWLDDATMPKCYTGGVTLTPEDMVATVPVPMQGFPPSGLGTQDAILGAHHSQVYTTNDYPYMLDGGNAPPYLQNTPSPFSIPRAAATSYGEEFQVPDENHRHFAYHPWGIDTYENPQSSQNLSLYMHPYQTQAHHSPINAFNTNITTANANINAYADSNLPLPTSTYVAGETLSRPNPNSQIRPSSTTVIDSLPNSWKAEGKQALLEILLETIGSCDEEHLPQVIHVLRTSPSPEQAVSGVCRVLGIGC